ncbi:MAG: response regulator, partial [Candidatus Aminicenantales bacterium]
PQFDGFAALDSFKTSGQDAPFIIVSGNIGEDIAVAAMRAGAHDYIMKDNLRRLVPAVDRELREVGVRRARRAAQDELDEATALLEKVFSITHVMVAYLDESFAFVRVNPAYAQAYGREPQDFQGKNYFDLFPDPTNEAMFRDVLETGRPTFSHAMPLPCGAGPGSGAVYVNRSVHRLTGPDGCIRGIILILLDVTREVLLDEHSRQAQKMEALGTLAGGIAHDFNNILSAIVINTELALLDGPDAEGWRQYLPPVLDAAERGKELVKQVLAFSRKKSRELKPVRPAPVIHEALRFLRASLPATIEIRDKITAEDSVTLSDATDIYRVLMNLGSNAAFAMRETGGVLGVAFDAVDLDDGAASRLPGLKPGPHVRLTVEDTGAGIPSEMLPRIFDPFFTTKGQAESVGMGLAVVHGIVTGSGGAISVESEVGEGSTFRVYFPRVEGDAVQDEDQSGPIPRGHEQVLVVDDERIQAESLRDMLRHLGYDVTFETDSVKALELLRSRPGDFDIVITDQTMPHLVGTRLAEEARKIHKGLPVVLCTGYSDCVNEKTAAGLGIRELVSKPFTIREMAAAIRRALDRPAG